MSKKKTEKNKEADEEVVVETKKEENTTKKTNKKELKTLISLVEECELGRPLIIFRLSINDYLNQFYDEEEKLKNNEFIEPSITEDEFKKIIGG